MCVFPLSLGHRFYLSFRAVLSPLPPFLLVSHPLPPFLLVLFHTYTYLSSFAGTARDRRRKKIKKKGNKQNVPAASASPYMHLFCLHPPSLVLLSTITAVRQSHSLHRSSTTPAHHYSASLGDPLCPGPAARGSLRARTVLVEGRR